MDANPPSVLIRNLAALLVLSCAVGAAACQGGETPSPTEPTPPVTMSDVHGTWSGSASDSSGEGTMTWQLAQTGTAVSGTVAVHDSATGVSGQGTITATVSGSTVNFSIVIPPSGFDAPFATCSASVSGAANVAGAVMEVTYTGTNSCTGTIAAGQSSLAKQ